jgi:uncharacterized membrane protein
MIWAPVMGEQRQLDLQSVLDRLVNTFLAGRIADKSLVVPGELER